MAVPSSDGRLTLVREIEMKTGISYPTTVPAVWVAVYDPTSNSWPYQQIMSGDLTKAGGPYGYFINNPQQIGNNTLYLLSGCSGNCNPAGQKLWPVTVAGLGVDYPRGAVLTANTGTEPAPVSYVALGDSYSSGEGVLPFDPSTNVSGQDVCHRSDLAYARLVSRNPQVGAMLNSGTFAACSGATTDQIFNANTSNHEPSQVSRLSASTKVVTITIGGNDIGFSDYAKACILDVCSIGSSAYNTVLDKINNVLPTNLLATYHLILTNAPNAKIYVLGYPQVAPVKTVNDPSDPRCEYLYSGKNSTGLYDEPWANARGARDILTKLDAQISASVKQVQNLNADYLRLQYVEVNGDNSPFAGHTVCADPGDSYFNNIDQVANSPFYVFHPNSNGQAAYARLTASAMTR